MVHYSKDPYPVLAPNLQNPGVSPVDITIKKNTIEQIGFGGILVTAVDSKILDNVIYGGNISGILKLL